MEKIYKFLTLKIRLILLGTGIAVLIFTSGMVTLYLYKNALNYSKLDNMLNQLNSSIVNLKDYELLSYYKQRDSLFDSGNAENTALAAKYLGEIATGFNLLESNDILNNSRQVKKIPRLKKDFENTVTKHNLFFQNIKELGSAKEGFFAQFYDAEKHVESSIKNFASNQTYQNNFDELKRNASNFFIRHDAIYYHSFEKEFQKFNKLLTNGDTTLSTIQYEKRKLIDDLMEYHSVFNILYVKENEIGLSITEGVISEILENLTKLHANIDILVDMVRTESDEKTQAVIFYYLLILVFVILIIILTTVLFSNLIEKELSKIRNYISELSIGKLPRSMKVETHSEIDDMLTNLNKIVDDLNRKAEFAEQIGHGKFDSIYKAVSEHDILGNALIEMKNSLQNKQVEADNRKKDEDKQDWTTFGMAKFSDILRENIDNIDKLSYELIINIIKYLNANQGNIYLYNNDNPEKPYLQLMACYAWDRRKYLEKKIEVGVGLIGTCAVEMVTYHITDIPADYISISSGFGKASPKNLLIVPLLLNKQVLGIVEVASFNEFAPHEIEFLEKTGDDIATTLSYMKINSQTSILLKQLQRQTEEMVTIEKSLRKEILELTATTDDLHQQLVDKQNLIDKIIRENHEENDVLRRQNEDLSKKYNESRHKTSNLELEKDKLLTDIILKNKEINQLKKKHIELVRQLETKQIELEKHKASL